MFGSEGEAAVYASGLSFARVRTCVVRAMFDYIIHFMADHF